MIFIIWIKIYNLFYIKATIFKFVGFLKYNCFRILSHIYTSCLNYKQYFTAIFKKDFTIVYCYFSLIRLGNITIYNIYFTICRKVGQWFSCIFYYWYYIFSF